MTPPAVGQERTETFRLVPAKASPASLVVTVETAAALPKRAVVHLLPPEGGSTFFAAATADLEGEGGRFTFAAAPPGTWRVVVRAGGKMFSGDGYFLPAEAPVTIAPAGATEVKVVLRLGGRLRIKAHDDDGKLLPATCTIRGASGDALEVGFMYPGVRVAYGALDDRVPSLVDPPLPAGPFKVELTHEGFEPRVLEAKVEEGKTIDVDALLVRR